MKTWVLLFTSAVACVFGEGCVVIFHGNASSGRTSISKEVERMQLSDWVVLSDDDIYRGKVVDNIAEHFSVEFEIMAKAIAPENRFDALKRGYVVFIEDTGEESEMQAMIALDAMRIYLDGDEGIVFKVIYSREVKQLRIDRVAQALSEGKNVLVDAWPDTRTSDFGDHPFMHVLLYSPLERSYDLFHKRNEEALETQDLTSFRYTDQLLWSYPSLYQMKAENSGRLAFPVCRNVVEEIFGKLEQEVVQNWEKGFSVRFTRYELNIWDLEVLKGIYFPEGMGETIYFEPKLNYDLIINAGEMSPSEAAHLLVERISLHIGNKT